MTYDTEDRNIKQRLSHVHNRLHNKNRTFVDALLSSKGKLPKVLSSSDTEFGGHKISLPEGKISSYLGNPLPLPYPINLQTDHVHDATVSVMDNEKTTETHNDINYFGSTAHDKLMRHISLTRRRLFQLNNHISLFNNETQLKSTLTESSSHSVIPDSSFEEQSSIRNQNTQPTKSHQYLSALLKKPRNPNMTYIDKSTQTEVGCYDITSPITVYEPGTIICSFDDSARTLSTIAEFRTRNRDLYYTMNLSYANCELSKIWKSRMTFTIVLLVVYLTIVLSYSLNYYMHNDF